MLFAFARGFWFYDPNGVHNMQFVKIDKQGQYLDFFDKRIPVQMVCPD
jgi:hypothetical protein